MKRICITGAGGMIGTALTNYALSQGWAVTALIRPGSEKKLDLHPNLTIAEQDLSTLECYEGEKCDAFVHLGWMATFGSGRDDTTLQLQNVEYTLSAVRLAKKLGCEVFVSVGSQAEYGLQDVPLSPKTPTFPLTGYGIAKLSAGHFSRLLCGQLRMRHCHVRILSVYGGNDREGTLISTCIRAMLHAEAPELTPCTQMWDYLYVEDAARGLFSVVERGRDKAVYVLGSGQCRPLRDYVNEIRKATRCPVEPKFGAKPFSEQQVQYLCADLSDLTKDTGFVPMVDFADGIRQTIKEKRLKGV